MLLPLLWCPSSTTYSFKLHTYVKGKSYSARFCIQYFTLQCQLKKPCHQVIRSSRQKTGTKNKTSKIDPLFISAVFLMNRLGHMYKLQDNTFLRIYLRNHTIKQEKYRWCFINPCSFILFAENSSLQSEIGWVTWSRGQHTANYLHFKRRNCCMNSSSSSVRINQART